METPTQHEILTMNKHKTIPCGWRRTGKIKEHLAHYRTCQHSFCVGRLLEWEKIKEHFRKEAKKVNGIDVPSA